MKQRQGMNYHKHHPRSNNEIIFQSAMVNTSLLYKISKPVVSKLNESPISSK